MAKFINFGNGQPSLADLPVAEVQKATELMWKQARNMKGSDDKVQSHPLEYGDYTLECRNALATFLTPHYQYAVSPRRLFMTGGVSHGLDVLSTALRVRQTELLRLEQHDGMQCEQYVALVEDPAYFLVFDIFRNHGIEVKPVRTDRDGPVPADLTAQIEVCSAAGKRVLLFYCIPVHNNPTGKTVGPDRRAALVSVCEKAGVFLVADEVYQLLSHRGADSPPAMGGCTPSPFVVSVSSTAKIMAPGLRVGWIEGEEKLVSQLAMSPLVMSGGSISQFAASVVSAAMRSGLATQCVSRLVTLHEQRALALCKALQRHAVPLGCAFERPRGGYFVWLQLPVSAVALEKACAAVVLFKVGSKFSADAASGRWDRYVRLCFARLRPEVLEEGVRFLCDILRRLLLVGHSRI